MLQHLADELPAGGRFAELGNRIERDGGRKRMLPQTNPSAMADPHECLVSKMHRSEADEVPMRVRRMLRTLPHMEQTVLRLRYGFGGEALSQQEVADRLGVVRKTAYNIEQRALQMLRGHEHIDALRRAA
jgi:RNA polymerase sigma factor (sigma-70 family)